MFDSLAATGHFSETTPYDPRSPYSASKAASDHLVNAWHHNYGPWRFPEKPMPLYGDGRNVRGWLNVDDHADALLPALTVNVAMPLIPRISTELGRTEPGIRTYR